MELQKEWLEFIVLLTKHRVRFLLVGAMAVAAHGRPRYTKDLDVFVASTEANARRLGRALTEFGYSTLGRRWRVMTTPYRRLVLGREPLEIDVLTSIAGIRFVDAWKDRLVVVSEGLTIPFLGLATLRANKLATGRSQDLADVEALDALTRAAARNPRKRRPKASSRTRTPGTRARRR